MLSTYRLLARVAHRLPGPPGVRESLEGRWRAAERWVTWAAGQSDRNPLVLVHAASVGEAQTAEPVVRHLTRRRPGLRAALTHTSPSPARIPGSGVFAHRDFLPLDEPTPMAAMLEVLGPACVVFSRGDLWPELVAQTAARGIPVAVIGATVRPASARLRWPARAVLQSMYRHVTWLGATTAADAERWQRLGVATDRITVTGDPRHDAVLERVPSLEPSRCVRAWAGQAPVLVAGSIEPSDDAVLAEALAELAGTVPDLHTLLIPHDAGVDRINRLRAVLGSQRVAAGTWTGPPGSIPDGRVTIVQAFGLLADLYLAAAVTYVGGGFARRRLHATIEPAAWGVPVLIGPHWKDAADAGALLATGAALALPAANAARALAGIVARLGRDGEERSSRGLAARATLATGASGITADAILGLLNR